jgi:predicted amidohydrolase
MVIAGSYHSPNKKRENSFKNVAKVFRYDGELLWKQKKMHRFQMSRQDIKQLMEDERPGFSSFQNHFNEELSRAWEKIDIHDTLMIFDSSIGRMAVCICLDFFVPERNTQLVSPYVNIIFVPALSKTVKRMKKESRASGSATHSAVFCANHCWMISGGENNTIKEEDTSFIYMPLKKFPKHLKCVQDCSKCKFPKQRISEIFQ